MVWIKAAGIGSRVEIEVVVTAVTVTRHRVRLSTRAMRAAFATAASCHQLCPPQSAMTVSRIKAICQTICRLQHKDYLLVSVGLSVELSVGLSVELSVGLAVGLAVGLSVDYKDCGSQMPAQGHPAS